MTAPSLPRQLATAGDELRLLPISAELLPVEIAEARYSRRVRQAVVAFVAACLLLLTAWFGQAWYQTFLARDGVDSTAAQMRRLVIQERAFTELVSTDAESLTIRTLLARLLVLDLQWSSLLSAVQHAAPTGVTFSNINVVIVTNTGAGSPTATTPPADVATTSTIGALVVTGAATTQAGVAACSDRLAALPGVANPIVGSAIVQNGLVQFTIRLDLDRSLLSGHYPVPTKQPVGN